VTGRVGAHGAGGHAVPDPAVECRVTSTHHPTDQTPHPTTPSRIVLSRPAQCLRHHKWMAACTDCRDARAADRQRAAASR
jgi:hypothetical protein